MTTLARRPSKRGDSPPFSANQRLSIRWNAVDPATRRPFILEWSIRREGDALLADAQRIDGADRAPLEQYADLPIVWTHDEHLRLDHFDAPGASAIDLPALNASVDLSAAPPTLIFARTTALSALGLPGGRYEPAGCAVTTD